MNHTNIDTDIHTDNILSTNQEVIADIEDTSDLDVSWINEQQRIQTIENNYCREPVTDIQVYSLYINKLSDIDKITRKKYPIHNNLLNRDAVLGIIQSNKYATSKKYKLIDVLLYHVDLEPQHIQTFSQSTDIPASSKPFFKILPIVDEIIIPPSIFIFHSINSVFFIYKETNTSSHNHTIKSILKHTSTINAAPRPTHTKQVRISMETLQHDFIPQRTNKPKKTRKNVIAISK